MLAWIDLEATGLIAAEHAVLEVAAIVTDDGLQEVARFHRVIYWPPAKRLSHLGANSTEDQIEHAANLTGIDRVVIGLHARNNLWKDVSESTHDLSNIDAQFADFLEQTSVGQDARRAQLAGSSIWLDRSFMSVKLPRALRQLHYKCVDVTTLNELARRFWPRLHQGIPSKREIHRAMPDIEDSLELCRYYAAQVA